jgi:hypothetical protein
MNLALLIQAAGTIGVFTGRAFLPAFSTALLLRFGPEIPWIAQTGFLEHVRGVPTWFTRDTTLVVLGILSALELAAVRFPEARGVLDEVHQYLKAGMAALTYMGVLSVSDRAVVGQVFGEAGMAESLPALAVGAAVYFAGRVRAAVVGFWTEADEDDDLGVQGLGRWVEDLWSGLGPVALILLPGATVAALGLAVALLFVMQRRAEARAEASNVPCGQCGGMISPCALACPHCGAEVEAPRAVGLLGRARKDAADPRRLPFDLVAVKRCPVCASRLKSRAVNQTCPECGHQLMDDPHFARGYISHIDRRVPLVVAACVLLGLVPILGVIPAVIFYRLALVAPFRRYIPPVRNFVLRWTVRFIVVLLVAIQWMPVVGGFVVPLMAMITYGTYRREYRRQALGG